MPRRLALLFGLFVSFAASAWEARLVDAQGNPIAGAQISIVDRAATARTGSDGRFQFPVDPDLPATLIVVGSRGELYPPLHVEMLLSEVALAEVYRESVTVSSGATPNTEGTPASARAVIGSEEIEQSKPQHVVDAVATMPGVTIRGEGPPAVPVVRGLAGGRTLLLIDDARIVSERRAGASATFVDPASLGSIEVSRGPGSVAYGSDAIGGVIHLRPRDPVAGASDYRYDIWSSFGAQRATSVMAEVSSDFSFGALLFSVHGRSAADAEDGRGVAIENSQYRDRGALLRFVRDASWGRLRVGAMTSVARDVGAPSIEPALTIYPDEQHTLLTFAADVHAAGAWDLASIRASAGTSSVTTDRVRASGVESATIDAKDLSLRLSGERTLGASRVVTGLDFVSRFDLTATNAIDEAERFDGGAYMTWSGSAMQDLHLSAGGRADYVVSRNHGGYFGNHDRSDVALSGFASATATPVRNVSATLQVATGYREPTLSDRYFRGISGRGLITGNPELEPERSVQVDGLVRWSSERSRVALFAYDYTIRDLVERYRDGADFFFRNRGEASLRGLELEAATRILPHLELHLGAAVARGEDKGSGDPLDDIEPPMVNTSLRWAFSRASAFATVNLYARDDRPGPVEVRRAGYGELDLGGGWRFSPHFEVRVIVRNALDRQRYGSPDEASAFATGRTVVVGVNR